MLGNSRPVRSLSPEGDQCQMISQSHLSKRCVVFTVYFMCISEDIVTFTMKGPGQGISFLLDIQNQPQNTLDI